ncbi:gamma-glutamylputrescine oxidase [Roseibium aquae]|uniref:Gamma-glutamylputrescine oxidase n=1 Tax=Roseibium aquae TaxID=1323746 RepID=A0A916TA13_9HYPH|nr:FAD-binding oxidoreductase [Roseibium aquae]GGB35810.1 gamma-glutamylputrescine oxidase [Roseibium aquae]
MLSNPDLLTANDTAGELPASYYAATAIRKTDYPALQGDLTCDVCVVGGGYTGLSTALHLGQRGYRVALLEAHKVGWGASGRNGGQVGPGQRVDQEVLESRHGIAHAKALWDLSLQSMDLLHALIRDHGIDCEFRPGLVEAVHRKDWLEETRDYVEHLRQVYAYDRIDYLDGDAIREWVASPAYFGGAYNRGAGHLHPLNFALGLATACETAGVDIFENSKVLRYRQGQTITVETEMGTVKARYLVLGCNGYLGRLDGQTAAHVMPINNFIIATEPFSPDEAAALIKDRAAVADTKFVINYFRLSSDNRLLFGGGETYSYTFPKDIKSFVRRPMLEIFPQLKDARIDYGWGGTLAITPKRMPYFARIAPNVLSASGYSGHGVAMATLAGQICAEAIDGIAGRFDLFERINVPAFPGGARFRYPLLVLAMTWFAMRDRLGI